MRKQILAVMLGLVVILGLGTASTSPSFADVDGPVKPGGTVVVYPTQVIRTQVQLSFSQNICYAPWSSPNAVRSYTAMTYMGDDTALIGNIVRKKPAAPYTCKNLGSVGLIEGEVVYGIPAAGTDGTDPVATVDPPPEPTDMGKLEPAGIEYTPLVSVGAYGQVCVAHPDDPNLVYRAFFSENDAYAENYLSGMIVRPFADSAVGCSAYNGERLQEWETVYNAGPLAPYTAPAPEVAIGEYSWDTPGTSQTGDSPISEADTSRIVNGVYPRYAMQNLLGCSGTHRLQTSNWAVDATYTSPDPYEKFGAFLETHKVRLVANALYYYCPNGTGPDKIKPLVIDYCVTHNGANGKGFFYSGTKFNGYIADQNTVTNPPTFTVNDSTDLQECREQDIPELKERWLKLNQDPQWSMFAVIDISLHPDKEVIFKTNDGFTRKQFKPLSDPILSGWTL